MSDNGDLIKLYSRQILALAADIPHSGALEHPQAHAKRRAPLCGSTIAVDLCTTADGRITEFAQKVRACALGQASASVLGGVVIGLDRASIARGRDHLAAMLQDGGPVPGAPFGGLAVLEPARDYKNRHGSILLAFDTTLEALDSLVAASTG